MRQFLYLSFAGSLAALRHHTNGSQLQVKSARPSTATSQMSKDYIYPNSATLLVERQSIVQDGRFSEGGYAHVLVREITSSPDGERVESDRGEQVTGGIGPAQCDAETPRTEDQGFEREEDAGKNSAGEHYASKSGACDVCNNLYMEPGLFYQADVERLKKASAGGCPVCLIIDAGFRHFDTEWSKQTDRWSLTFAPSRTALQVSVSKPALALRDKDSLDFFTRPGMLSVYSRFISMSDTLTRF